MAVYYDDNFGQWDIEDPEDLALYKAFQKTNVLKRCKGCGRKVKIQPHYAYCDSCCRKLEAGGDL